MLQMTSGIFQFLSQFGFGLAKRGHPVFREFAEKDQLGEGGQLRRGSAGEAAQFVKLHRSGQEHLAEDCFRRELQCHHRLVGQ